MTGTGTAGCCARDLWLALVPNPLRDGDAFAFDRGVRRSTSITPDDRFYQNLADCIDTWLGPPQPRRDEHECPRTQSRRNDHESSEILSVLLPPLLVMMSATTALAQPAPPSWECRAARVGDQSCRALWDVRDRAPPPIIQGAPQQ